MKASRKVLFVATVLLGLPTISSFAQDRGPIIATGAERAAIESTPIEYRPYRPLHFYGNTVRRQYYRGSALPAPREISGGVGVIRRR